ncbi:ABC transporter ATP-binding protein [Pseudoflavonifractor gallinarum]|uniref:ABC transporter ATP-binding protein n=1 Tax=Pseudoflavonifractor gallinarum TaxID=2779352 RepID=UPI0036F2D920
MEEMTCMIQCENITKKYALYSRKVDRLLEAMRPGGRSYHKDFYALQGITFSMHKGECVGIVGKNGSGKSTLLKILTGVLTPTEGSVHVQGRVSALLELGAGFNPEYTGYENIYLNGSIMGYSREEMQRKLPEIIEFADIGDFINQPVKIYSSGMFVRLAFAVAISVDPEILIIDEALAVGDVFFQLKCYKKIEDFKKQGKTILFVSHDQSSIIKYCDRAILLDKGRMVCDGAPKEVIDEYKQILAVEKQQNQPHPEEAMPEEKRESICWKTQYALNEKILEYGDRQAEITDFGIFDESGNLATIYNRNSVYTIKMKVLFHAEIQNPIYAITFKDMSGLEVAGTNTMQENVDTGTVKPGQTVTVSFRQKFPFQNYPLFLSLGCTKFDGQGELRVLHRLYDVLCIQTLGAKITNGFFDIDSKVRIAQQ